ncbi:LOW QUALITY PROTEIN: uncharacterized protein NKAPD1 [Rhinatrema bivittatum]|uniref:LOW QUALITY PROTEIN: uncharacterized protein NKAPD1 n=1 Tax=Rhinatrema bivittatum TaxID=194408 RepID=UPI00112AD6D9|nr:LOW QUALITY PROTEIN: uncharacterized protein NKAPD1 [Rhinatrema bivittatum]
MSRVPLGKVLLRNVIRQTDAHNKIQEESEMWKIRELEKQTEETYSTKRRASSPNVARWDHSGYRELYPEEFNTGKSRMRSDGFDDDGSHREDRRVETLGQTAEALEQDLRKAQYWNRRIYECEASIPDRWGHSGYKELYPEEFDTDSDGQGRDEKFALNGKEKPQSGKHATQESRKRKRPKKSHKKKQRKRSHKKLKKRRKEGQSESSSDSESSEESAGKARKVRQKRKKTRKKASRRPPPSCGAESESSDTTIETSNSSGEGKPPEKKKSWTKRRKKKRHRAQPRHDPETQEKSKRKNWKVANDERSEESSDED